VRNESARAPAKMRMSGVQRREVRMSLLERRSRSRERRQNGGPEHPLPTHVASATGDDLRERVAQRMARGVPNAGGSADAREDASNHGVRDAGGASGRLTSSPGRRGADSACDAIDVVAGCEPKRRAPTRDRISTAEASDEGKAAAQCCPCPFFGRPPATPSASAYQSARRLRPNPRNTQ